MKKRRRTGVEDNNPEFDELRKKIARYEKLQVQTDAAGALARGEAARLVRLGWALEVRGYPTAVGRVSDWSREYVTRLAQEVDDQGQPLTPASTDGEAAGQ